MTIAFTCPHCGTNSQIDEQYAGQTGPCRACGKKVTVPLMEGISPRQSASKGVTIAVIAVTIFMGLVVCGGIGTALLLPAVTVSRESASRMHCTNNLKQIALALHNYHAVYKSFPPAYTVDSAGEPLHSWRTLILPFLDAEHVYSRIALDKPWDDPINRAFNDADISPFRCPSGPSNAGCSYVAIVGPNSVFQGSTPVSISQIVDGTSQTIMLVELRDNPRSWMEPFDLDAGGILYQINLGSTEPGSYHPGGLNVALVDGSVRFISETVSKKVLQALTTINGSETDRLP